MNWKIIEVKLFALIEKVVQRVLQAQNEQWVSAQELSERIPIFSANFLKKHGECLPREKMEYIEDGKVVETRYMYPLHALNAMVQRGQFRTADGTTHALEAYQAMK